MNRWTRLLLALSPVLGTLFLASVIQPLYAEIEVLKTDTQNKKADYARLEHSLIEKGLLEKKTRSLQEDLAKLKKNLPEDDQLEVVLYDLDKMAHESGISLVSVELPDEKKKSGDAKDSIDAVFEEMGKKIPVAQIAVPGAKAPVKTPEAKTADIGLRHISKRIYLSGNFPDLVVFLKKLEDYERVINISDLIVASVNTEKSGDRAAALEKVKKVVGDKPVMTFVMNVYYMPNMTDGAKS